MKELRKGIFKLRKGLWQWKKDPSLIRMHKKRQKMICIIKMVLFKKRSGLISMLKRHPMLQKLLMSK